MAGLLPPTPVGVPPGHSFWNDWYEKLRDLINNGNFSFSALNFAGSNLTSIATRNHNDLQNIQGGAASDNYHLTNAQHTDLTDAGDSALHFHSSDRARANHTGTQLMSTISDLPTLASGTYTPTLTSILNVAATTNYTAQYIRVGNVVTVSGRVDIDPTAGSTFTQVDISLPIASALTATEQVSGVCHTNNVFGLGGAVYAETTNDRARLEYVADAGAASHPFFYTFTYRVI